MELLSSDLALDDFLRRALLFPVRVMLERLYLPPEVHAARAYSAETDRLRQQLEGGVRAA
jgi:hypothetical protein